MLYFDEAGYTGPDLTNKEQPYFALASIRMTDDEVACMKKDIGYCEWGKELHFKSMYTNPHGRVMLDKIFNHPLMDDNHVLPSFAYKRYCIYANIVNILVETMYYNQGVNLYEGSKNLILANGLYYFATLHPNKDLMTEFENCFVTMVRKPSVGSVANFYRTTDKLVYNADTKDGFFEMLSEIPPTIQYIKEALTDKKFYIDPTIPLFSVSIQEWYKRTGEKDTVLFDSSEPFYANKEFMEHLRDMDVPETVVGYGKEKHVYPLPVGNMEIVKSHEWVGEFEQFYKQQILNFPKKNLVFDEEKQVMNQIAGEDIIIDGKTLNNYSFKESGSDAMIQVCDYVVSFLRKYIIFLDRLESEVDADIQNFDENQTNNYKLLNRILAVSLDYNPLFVHFVASQHTVAKYHMYIKKYGKIE